MNLATHKREKYIGRVRAFPKIGRVEIMHTDRYAEA